MSSVDRRVVEMEFDNKQFGRGIRETLDSLEALKKGLSLDDAAKGLHNLEDAGKRFSLDGIAAGVDNISSKFSAMGAIGFTVIQELTQAAMDYAKRMAGLVLDPLVEGGRRRALNIEQAKFQFAGLGMDIEDTMDSALQAVTGTAYGLDEAAKVAGQFGASGMRAGEDMTSALRAISGVAAMTSSEYEDIGNVFTKVAGNGRVMGDDLLRMSSRGLNAAATLADSLGITEQEVRELVTEGEISFEMFYKAMDEAFGENATKANETYTGSLANLRAALSRIGASFFGTFLEQQRDLFNTLSPAIDSVGEALEPVIDMMLEMTGARTERLISWIESLDLSKLDLVIDPSLGIINNVLEAMMGLLKPLRDAFRQIFPPTTIEQVGAILSSIESFTETIKMGEERADELRRTFAGLFAIFGIGWEIVKEGSVFLADLFGIAFDGSGSILSATANVGDFLVALHEAVQKGEGLTSFFEGLTDILRGPIKLVRTLSKALLSLFEFDAADADEITEAFERFQPLTFMGNAILQIWENVLNALGKVWEFFQPMGAAFAEMFGDTGTAIMEALQDLDFDRVIDILQTGLFAQLVLIIRRFTRDFSGSVGSATSKLTAPFYNLTLTLRRMQGTLQAMTLLGIAVAIGVLAASVVALSKVDASGLTKASAAMAAMITQLVAAMYSIQAIGGSKGLISTGAGLILFATGLRILTSSVKALADLSWEELVKGLSGVTALIGSLIASVRIMSGHTAGMFKAGAGLLVLSLGIKILASAVTDLAGISWEEMAKGLVGVGTLLGALALFTKFAAANKGAVGQGVSLVLLATGIKILASAVSDFGSMSWENVGKGLSSVTAILIAFAGFSHVIKPNALVRTGVSLVLVGAAMKILASAIDDFSDMSWIEIARGLTAMSGALLAIVLTLNLLPPSTLASAAALVLVSFALGKIGEALSDMGGMSWDEIARGLVTLAGSLAIIAAAVLVMQSAIAGAAAIFVVSAALRTLAPVLQAFGAMSWGEIVRGLTMLAGSFVVMGLAGLVLGPLVPVLLGLGAAIALLGVGLLAAGAGVLFFATGLTALAAAGAAGTAAVVAMVAGLIGLLPMVAEQLGLALIIFAQVIAAAGPEMLAAMSAVLGAIIGALEENVPKVVDFFYDMLEQMLERLIGFVPKIADGALKIMIAILESLNDKAPTIVSEIAKLLRAMLDEMTKKIPSMARSATRLIVSFLNSVENNLGDVITAGTDVIIALVKGISDNMSRLVDEGFDAVISFINGVANSIRRRSYELRGAGRNLATAIIDGLTGGLGSKTWKVVSKAKEVAKSALTAAKNFLDVRSPSKEFEKIGIQSGEGLAIGIANTASTVGKASESVSEDALDVMRRSMTDLSDILEMDADMDPTITPVLDLSKFHKDASLINSSLSGQKIDVDMAYSEAKKASSSYRAREEDQRVPSDAGDPVPPMEVTYNQYNTSPKALSSAEIYRQTKNQLSVTKGALTPNVAQED